MKEEGFDFLEAEGEVSSSDTTFVEQEDIVALEEMLDGDAVVIAAKVNEVLNSVHRDLILTSKWSDKDIEELDNTVRKICNQHDEYRESVIQKVQYKIASNVHGVEVLQPLMDDPEITEIEVIAFDRIYAVSFKGRFLTDIKFPSSEALGRFATKIVDFAGASLSAETPILDFTLANRTRVNVVGIWASTKRTPYISMRKPPTATKQVNRDVLIDWGAFTLPMEELMQLNSNGKMNVLLSGETNSGKTTYIRMLMGMIDPKSMERIILLQDSPEIDPVDTDLALVLLQTINRKVSPITFFDLLKSTLRMNPDRTWLGEFRGIEAAEMIESNLAGARGTLASGHADSPANMIMRIVILMYRAGFTFGEHIIRQIIHQSVDFIYQTAILPDGTKKIVEICEVLPLDVAEAEGNPTGLRTIFEYQIQDLVTDDDGIITEVVGEHKLVNLLSNHKRKKLLKYGVRTPDFLGGVPKWA
ncbi:Type IV secretion system protein VirB11 [compost metagenome]